MPVHIRHYRQADCSAVKELIRQVWTEHFGTHPEQIVREYMNQPGTLADIGAHIYESPKGAFLIAEDAAELIGCGAMLGLSPEVCEVKRMYVSRESRRGGVGRQVLFELLRLAAQAGYRTARLTTNKSLTASHRLYESAGFARVDSWDPEAEAYVYFYSRQLSPKHPSVD